MALHKLLILLLLSITLWGKTFSYQQVHAMPTSIEKDYYIWRFLSQSSTTPLEAKMIIREASGINKKLETAYRKKTGYLPPTIRNRAITAPTRATGAKERWRRRVRANRYFRQGLKLLREGRPQKAVAYLDAAHKNYSKRMDKDKTLFWLYLATKKKYYLRALRRSEQPNIYTLLADDAFRDRYPETITYRIRREKTPGFDITDPIAWAKLKAKMNYTDDLDELADDFESQECLGIHTYIKAKACRHTRAFFPMPYRDIMKRLPKERQALIYALARQESRFVPASISRSFALGMMQFMPFLIDHIAREKGEKIDYDEIFNPKKAIEYANFHLNYLTKYLHHPLFIAYAYNGGIGFTKHYIQNPKHFRYGPYEPYMSMEVMENEETREYGKKVLANYIIYMNKLGVPTRIFPLMKVLATPQMTDGFRK